MMAVEHGAQQECNKIDVAPLGACICNVLFETVLILLKCPLNNNIGQTYVEKGGFS